MRVDGRIFRKKQSLQYRWGRGIAAFFLLVLVSLFSAACLGGGGKSETEPPEISVRYPDVNATDVPVSASVTITFNESVKGINGSSGIFTIRRLSAATDVPADVTYDDASYTATLTPRETLEPDSYYVATLGAAIRDRVGNYIKEAPISWVFITGEIDDTENPEITQRSPYPGEQNVPSGKMITIKFSELVNYISDTTVTLRETATGDAVTGSVTYSEQIATFVPDADLAEGTQYTLTCIGGASGIRDSSGNALVTSEWAFKIEDTTPPEISTISPLENANNVPPNAEVQVTFSESITNATNSSVYLKEVSTGVTYPSRVEYDDLSKAVTLKPSGDLQYNTLYQITIEGGSGDSIMDTSFNAVAADRIWTFTTSNAPDDVSPVVDSVSPVESAGSVVPSTDITIEFNEDVASVSTSSVILKKNSDNSTVSTTITYDSVNKRATANPVSDLEEGASYTVSCTDTIKDGAGNPLVPKTWTFIIADETAPVVTGRSPESAATAVKKNGRVIVDFSEDVTGVSTSTFYLRNSVNSDVTSVVTYDSDARRAILTPTSYLGDNESYTVYLTAGISDTSANANALAAMNWSFETESTLDTTAPVILNRNPGDGDSNVALESQVSITFDESVTGVSNTTFKLKKGVDIVSGLVSFDAATKTAVYYPDEDLKGGTVYTVEVTGAIQDLSGNAFIADSWTFTTEPDTAAPVIEERSPTNGQSDVAIDTAVVVKFNENVNGIDATTFIVEDDQGDAFTAGEVNVSYDAGSSTVIWSLKDSVLNRGTGTTYTVTLTSGITDDAGNALVGTSWSFTTEPDTTPPAVMSGSESPRNGSTAISINTSIAVSFSEDLDLSSLSTNSFYIEETATGIKKTDVSYNFDTGGKMAIISLDTPLDGTTEYTVHVISGASGVKDLGQNSIPADYVWSFTTGQVPDTTVPEVNTVAPTDASTGVALNLASITAQFSEEVQNVNSSTFQLKTNGVAVAAVVNYDNGTNTATLAPAYNLLEGTTYTVELKTSITDLASNPLASAYTWSFSTGVTDTIKPIVSSYTPEGGGAQVRPTVSVVFSESVTGVSNTTFILSQGGSPVENVDVFYDDSTKTATLTPRDSLSSGLQYDVTLTTGIADLAGNNLNSTSWNFTPTTPPAISSCSPGDADTDVSVILSTATINFTRAMDQASGNAVLSGGPGRLGNPTWVDSDTISYPVIGTLAENTEYTVTFESWWGPFKDTDGNELDVTPVIGGTLTFTTGSDGSAPTIVSSLPVNGATNVGTDIPVMVINFSEPMTAAGTLSGISVGGASWSNSNTTVVFPVSSTLTGSTGYNVTLNGFSDVAGNPLSGNSLSFTTSALSGSVLISEASESFESYSEPDFSSYTNAAGDNGEWIQAVKSGNPTAIPFEGTSMAIAPTLAWSNGDVAYLEQRSSADFSTGGSYIMSVRMSHETLSPAGDHLRISVSTDGGSNFNPVGSTVYRYGYFAGTPVYITHAGTGLDNFDPNDYRSSDGRIRIPQDDTVVSGIDTSTDFFVDASEAWFAINSVSENTFGTDRIYIASGQTVNVGAGCKVMTPSTWVTHYYDLSPYAGESSVLIRIEAVSAGDTGGYIVIDDVQVRRY